MIAAATACRTFKFCNGFAGDMSRRLNWIRLNRMVSTLLTTTPLDCANRGAWSVGTFQIQSVPPLSNSAICVELSGIRQEFYLV